MAKDLHRAFSQTWFCSEQVKVQTVPVSPEWGAEGSSARADGLDAHADMEAPRWGQAKASQGLSDGTRQKPGCTADTWRESHGLRSSTNFCSLSWRHKDIFTWPWTPPTLSLNMPLPLVLPYGLFKVVYHLLREMLSMYSSIPFIQGSSPAFQEYYLQYSGYWWFHMLFILYNVPWQLN